MISLIRLDGNKLHATFSVTRKIGGPTNQVIHYETEISPDMRVKALFDIQALVQKNVDEAIEKETKNG